MSSWGKLLVRDVVIPAGGWGFAWVDGGGAQSCTVPAGTYDTVFHVAKALEDAMKAEEGTSEVEISEVGIVTIAVDDLASITWGSCADALTTLLGFDETEAVSQGVVVSSLPHTHGWYPGCITHNHLTTRGAGLTGGAFWIPVDVAVRTWSGAGDQRTAHPGTSPLRRTVTFDIIDKAEVKNLDRGVAALWDEHLSKKLSWYMDRAVGAVGSYGTQGNPRADTDDDCDWWKVALVKKPKAPKVPSSSGLHTIEMLFNAESSS